MGVGGAEKYEMGPYANCHRVLGRALRTAPEAIRPGPPYQLAGPRPRLRGRAPLGLALWLADLARQDLRETHRATFEAQVGVAQEVFDGVDHSVKELYQRTAALKSGNEHLQIARMTGVAALQTLQRFPNRATDSVVAIANRLVRRVEDPAGFLRALDKRICLEEARQELADRMPEGAICVEVLFRGDRGNGTAGHFLLRMENGDYGLVTKMQRKWTWFEGDRDEMLATLPDAVFGQGVRAALG